MFHLLSAHNWFCMNINHRSIQNMPLRDLFYTACVLSGLIMNENIYGKHQIMVPEPKFVIFYNGKEKVPERSELRLSDAYEKHSGTPALELVIQVININYGCNKELMEKSRTLREYMIFVETVRNYEKEYSFKEAVERAIDDCIRNNILRSFLIKSRAEVLRMFLLMYDQEKHIRQEKDESREEGRKEGIKEGRKEGIKLGRAEGLELGEIQMLVKQIQKGRITMEEAAEDCRDDSGKVYRCDGACYVTADIEDKSVSVQNAHR